MLKIEVNTFFFYTITFFEKKEVEKHLFKITIFAIIKSNLKMNKNKVLAYATFIMILMGFLLIALGAFRYDDVAGWGFAAVGVGFLSVAWVFNALKGRV